MASTNVGVGGNNSAIKKYKQANNFSIKATGESNEASLLKHMQKTMSIQLRQYQDNKNHLKHLKKVESNLSLQRRE